MSWQQSERTPALIALPPAASLDEAHAAIELWEYYSRKRLDAEQRLAVELMMAEADDGRWAADTTGRAESRQNGKGDEIEVVELWGLTQRSEAILHTAHEAATAASAHGRLIGLVEGHRDLRVKVKKKQSWNGNYSLLLNNDGLIVWRTRTGAGGRGLDDISRIVVDEAQHAQPEELASSLPILSVNPNPQKNFIGSGGVAGKSGFWWRQRRRALTGIPSRFSWLEHSAEVVTLDSAGRVITSVGDVAAPQVWRRANPAYPARISHDFLLDQLETLGPELFAREHLCVWDPEPGATDSGVFGAGSWDALRSNAPDDPPAAFAVDMTWDREWASVAVSTGGYVDVVEHRRGAAWVVELAVKLQAKHDVPFWLDPKGPAATLIDPLCDAGVRVEEVPSDDYKRACGGFYDAVDSGDVSHSGYPALDAAVAGAVVSGGSGGWVWDRKKGAVISPLVAATLAWWGSKHSAEPRVRSL